MSEENTNATPPHRGRFGFRILAAAALSILGAVALYRGREKIAEPRTIRFRGPDGKDVPEAPSCHGPIFADGRAAWTGCETGRHGGQPTSDHLVRFDLDRGIAELRWPLPSKSDEIVALARHRSGRLAILLFNGELVLADPAGGLSVVGHVPEAPLVAGLAWLGDDLEVIVQRGPGEDEVFTLSGGRWTRQQLPMIQEAPGMVMRLVMAEHGPEGRVLTYVRSTDRHGPDLDVITRLPDGSQSIERLRLPDRPDEAGYDVDSSAGNVVQWSAAAWDRTLERVHGKWQFVRPPPNGGRLFDSDYVVQDGRLDWILDDSYGSPGAVRIGGRWLPARQQLLPIAGTTDLWALETRGWQVRRVDRDLRPLETTAASPLEHSLALAALMASPLAAAVTLVVRRRRRRHLMQ